MSAIVHKGIIRRTAEGLTEVELVDGMECESCSVKGACQIGEVRDKVLPVDSSVAYQEGEMVSVELSSQMAFGALFWAYIFPFIVLITGLILLSLFLNEALSALIALAFLAIYYFLVYLNKDYFDKKFQLKINRLNHD